MVEAGRVGDVVGTEESSVWPEVSAGSDESGLRVWSEEGTGTAGVGGEARTGANAGARPGAGVGHCPRQARGHSPGRA